MRVPKLSSVSTILPACLVTSLPEPMATPMSAFFNAAASLTASPVIATTAPPLCMTSTKRSLSCGVTRPNTCRFGNAVDSSSSVIACNSPPPTEPGAESEFGTDRCGGDGMVAGDHADPRCRPGVRFAPNRPPPDAAGR